MILIYGGWAADVYEKGYVVGKIGTTFDAKTGKEREILKDYHYFHNLSDCVDFAYKEILREQLGKHRKNLSLEDAIRDMRDVERKMEANLAGMNVLIEEYSQELQRRAER